jgi:hypothetical protein
MVGEESPAEQGAGSARRRVEELARRLTHPLARQRSTASELAQGDAAADKAVGSAAVEDGASAARRRAAMAHLQTAAVLETLGYHDRAQVHWRAARADQEAAQDDAATAASDQARPPSDRSAHREP